MSIGHAVNNSKYMKAITFTLMASMILLSSLATAAQDAHSKKDIVDVAVANGNFNTLAAALKAAILGTSLLKPVLRRALFPWKAAPELRLLPFVVKRLQRTPVSNFVVLQMGLRSSICNENH